MEDLTEERKNYLQAENSPLRIDYPGEENLKTAAKWGQFIAIVNYIGIGFLIVISIMLIAMNSSLQEYQDFNNYPMALIGIIYLVLAIIYFFPVYFLSRFCSKLKQAFINRDENILSKAFEYLKNLNLYMGIIYILSLLFMIFFIIIMVFFVGTIAALV